MLEFSLGALSPQSKKMSTLIQILTNNIDICVSFISVLYVSFSRCVSDYSVVISTS